MHVGFRIDARRALPASRRFAAVASGVAVPQPGPLWHPSAKVANASSQSWAQASDVCARRRAVCASFYAPPLRGFAASTEKDGSDAASRSSPQSRKDDTVSRGEEDASPPGSPSSPASRPSWRAADGAAFDRVGSSGSTAGPVKTKGGSLPRTRAEWVADLTSVPNVLSIARGVAGPIVGIAIVTDQPPGIILGSVVAAGISDWLDGYVARRWNMSSVLGSYLDPIGDKAFVASVALALAAKGVLPAWLAACVLARDAALIAGVSYQRARALGWRWETWGRYFGVADAGDDDDARRRNETLHALPPLEPQLLGKVSTAVQFSLFTAALLQQTAGWPGVEFVEALCVVTGGTTLVSSATYWFLSTDIFARNPRRRDEP